MNAKPPNPAAGGGAGDYVHTRQFKRLKKVLRRRYTILGIVLREVQRKRAELPQAAQDKLYALHAPQAECLSNGKSRNLYEFGASASMAVTHKQGRSQDLKVKPTAAIADLGYRGL